MSSQAIGGFASKKWVAAANGPDAFGLTCRLNKLLECIACAKLKPDLHRLAGQPHRAQPAHQLLGDIALHVLDHEGLGASGCQKLGLVDT